jgi:hypothetical protein
LPLRGDSKDSHRQLKRTDACAEVLVAIERGQLLLAERGEGHQQPVHH